MKKRTVLFVLLGFLLVTSTLSMDESADDVEDEEEADEGKVEDETETDEVKPPTAAATSDKDVEEEEVKKLEPSPDVETTIVFTSPPNNKELPAGSLVKFLVGFYNKGEKDFVVDSMDASFRYPMDYSFYIQNYTAAYFQRSVGPDQESTLDYAFVPGEGFASRPFGLTINLNYRDSDGKEYQNAVFNETINVIEEDVGLNPETGFLYVVFGCLVILLLLLGQQLLLKMRKKHGITKKQPSAPVEFGTTNKNEVDLDWIPQQVLNMASNKSPRTSQGSPGRSPRQRKARRAGVDH